ncbi:Transglutaminase-like superfamily protein [Candidatus Anstonella stagnisolia]|nr:Transglutaminase-like superfamily protein [Candidatus Anstonella stagnisolia]
MEGMRGLNPAVHILCFLLLAALLFAGCCGYADAVNEKANEANQAAAQNSGTSAQAAQSVAQQTNRAPVVRLSILNDSSGPAPFYVHYSYNCYDPDNDLVSCEMKIDGRAFAKGSNMSTLFGKNFTYPQFYWAAQKEMGKHTLEMYAVDATGMNSSKVVEFEVLKPLPISKPGWYRCNGLPNTEPCDTMLEAYCSKFTPTDLSVRQAAAQAISKHPGQFSINQLLDIYDWVHSNVFYHNVPLDMYPPYNPNETLATKSGDCKNQAVLIASMVEAVGGSSRVLLIPDCHHAFAEVYLGTDDQTKDLTDAIWAHYSTQGQKLNWHLSKGADNKTQNWFIFDTAGGSFPGNTIDECIKPNYTFEIRDCSRDAEELNAPISAGTAYDERVRMNETQAIYAGWTYNYWWDPTPVIPTPYKWCHYKLDIKSLSPGVFSWYVTDEEGYKNHDAGRSFSFYKSGENVHEQSAEFDWDKHQKFYILIKNTGEASITANMQLAETCYKG